MKIEREVLITSLEQFALDGSGVVIGSPGVGKTYSLMKLKKLFKDKKIPHLILPIDRLGDGTTKELQEILSFKDDLIEKLKKEISQLKLPGIILIDAFDSARNEEIRERFLNLIRRFLTELKSFWNVIVTVRTYDAIKSQRLLELFGNLPNSDNYSYFNPEIQCRHFMIPLLNDGEIKQAIDQIPNLGRVYEKATSDFKELLKIPFNLWLIERILKDAKDIPDTSNVRSEVQLLGLFWEKRVNTKNDFQARENILTRLVRKMVEQNSLSFRKEYIYKIYEDNIWTKLYSDEILIQVSTAKQRVAFSHNILFDYAVSILLIEDDAKELKKFVLENPSRPVFLRPSLDYYFTRLWNDTPSIFWNVYRDILLNTDQNLRLFTRLLPPLVIAREARNIHEFNPLLNMLKNEQNIAYEAMLRILQAYKSFDIKRDKLWIQLFERVSMHLNRVFTWDMAVITADIIDRAINTDNDDVLSICGKVSRSILNWIWEKRKDKNEKEWFDRFGTLKVVPLVAKTFKTDVKESRKLLDKIFNLTNEKEFPTQYFYYLSQYIDNILPYNSELVALVYKAVFEYEEKSEEKTTLGTPVIQMTSTRRQDFHMCQYILTKHYPSFIKKSPELALKISIQFLNIYIRDHHIIGYLKKGVTFEDLKRKFQFRGKEATYINDGSYIWGDSNHYREEPLEIADQIFSYFSEIAKSGENNELLESLLDIFRDHVQVAYFWKRLLSTARKFPEVFTPLLFELCIARPIQVEPETIHDLGLFLEKTAGYLSQGQLKQIEHSILTIPKGEENEEQRAYREEDRNRLLACIPETMLTTPEAKEIIEKLKLIDKIPHNKPLFKMEIRSGDVTPQMLLEERGVDVEQKENKILMDFFEPLDDYYSTWSNKFPNQESIKKILIVAQNAYKKIQSVQGADKKLGDMLWTKLASVAETISRSRIDTEGDVFNFCREVLLNCSQHELPIYNEGADEQFKTPMWSPAPRIEAAQGLLQLAFIGADDEILSAIKNLAFDKVPAVRFLLGEHLSNLYPKSRDFFWELIEDFAKREKNRVIQDALCRSLCKVVSQEETKPEKVLSLILENQLSSSESIGFSDCTPYLLIWLYLKKRSRWAIDNVKKLINDATNYSCYLKSLSFKLLKYLDPVKIKYSEQEADFVVETLDEFIIAVAKGLKKFPTTAENEIDENQQIRMRNLYELIDEIVTRLYFHTYTKENNNEEQVISDEQLENFYWKIKPLLNRILSSQKSNGKTILGASTAHYFMQLLNNVLKFDPNGVLQMAALVALASKPFGYNLDYLAVREVVNLVETILADFRKEVRFGSSLQDLLDLLDIFAEAGWPETIQLTWRLDEIFR